MLTEQVNSCCSSAHNLDIVRRELESAQDENRQLRLLVDDLERFQRLVWALLGARILPEKKR